MQTGKAYKEIPKGILYKVGVHVFPDVPGIYFLWDKDEIIYIGRAKNLSKRVNDWHSKISNGDLVSYVCVNDEDLEEAEKYYIRKFTPRLNVAHNPSPNQKNEINIPALFTNGKLLTPKELADFLQISEKTLAQLRWRGEGPRFLRIVGTIRYAMSDVVFYLEHCRFQNSAEFRIHKRKMNQDGEN